MPRDREAQDISDDSERPAVEIRPTSFIAPKPDPRADLGAQGDTKEANRASGFRWSAPNPLGSAASLALAEPKVGLLDPRIAAVLERCFVRLCGRDSNIDARELGSALEIQNEYLAQRILCVLDADRDGLIDHEDFLGSIRTLLFGSARERLVFAFRIHDLDEDQLLDRDELQQMIALGLREDSLDASEREAARLTDLLLAGADRDRDQRVSFAEFEAAVQKHASVLEQITESGLIWIAPDEHVREYVERCVAGTPSAGLFARIQAGAARVLRTLENRAIAVMLLVGWAMLNAVLFVAAMIEYAELGSPVSVLIARGAGACLKLNAALLLLPMLRLMLTRVRRTPWLRWLPVDDAAAFHRLLGAALLVFAAIHTAAHLWHVAPTFHGHPLRVIATMPAGLTGVALLLGLLVLGVCSLPSIRGRHFELFHFTHLLYVGFFPLLLVHGFAFWRWGAIPCLWFVVDRGLRFWRRTHMTEVVAASALRSDVTRLELARPADFAHRPTDYVFIRIPEIAAYEWHPFTISSAPETPRLTLHIRTLGNWTRQLHALIASGRAPQLPGLQVELDGPYGAPCSHIFEARHVVLIGAGIGATPFASVLESLVLGAQSDEPRTSLEKVHFFWINRDQSGFEWFRQLLSTFERLDAGRLLDIRIYMTQGRNDAASAVVSLAREFAHEKGRPDLVTGLQARTSMGRPNFADQLRAIAALHAPDPVSVFFCGPPGLARKVKAVCLDLGMPFRQEHF